MRTIFKFSAVSKKSTTMIVSMIAVLMLLFLCIVIPLEINFYKEQIKSSENKIIANADSTFKTELSNVMNAAVFLSTIKIYELGDEYTPNDYKDYLIMEKQILAAKSISYSISDISICDGEKQYLTDNWFTETGNYKQLSDSDKIRFVKNAANEYFIEYVSTQNYNRVLIKLDNAAISETVFNTLDKNCSAGFVDSDGIIAFASEKNYIGQNFYDLFGEYSAVPHSVKKIKVGGEKSYLTNRKTDSYDLYLYNISGKETHTKYLSGLVLLIAAAVAILFITFAVSVIICWAAYVPFKKILDTFGLPHSAIPEDSIKEYDYIIANIKSIEQKNTRLNETVNQALHDLKAQQFIACQMQICPHFVFNMLSTISSMSVIRLKDGNNEITRSINSLAQVLTKALKIEEPVTEIRDEVQLTKDFLDILYIRYDNNFTVEWNIDSELNNCFIIKLSLQPLIENAVSHAFTADGKNQKIKLSIQQENDEITVCVEDNGAGITTDKLARISERMNDFSFMSSENIGLRNVNQRIKLIYGDKYGLKVESVAGVGSRFCFSYPKSITGNNR